VDLFLSVVVGLIGSAYILYGRRQYEPWFIACGFALVAYPYFVSDTLITLLIGTVLALLPILMR
jgi:hypothetical protein